MIFAGLIVAGGTSLFTVRMFGLIAGEEFSPQTFQLRTFHYYEIPLLRLQVSPVYHNPMRDKLTQYLLSQKYVEAQKGSEVQWDLVEARRTNLARIGGGDAEFLFAYLRLRDANGELRWLTWSKEHPESARVLWPAVAEIARARLYFLVPDLIELALGQEDPDQLQIEIDRRLAIRYQELAQVRQRLGRHQEAISLLDRAIALEPGAARLLQMRSDSLQKLGRKAEAAADAERARALKRQPTPGSEGERSASN